MKRVITITIESDAANESAEHVQAFRNFLCEAADSFWEEREAVETEITINISQAVMDEVRDIHIIDNRTPESIDQILGAVKWMDRIAQRYEQLPQSFTDNIPAKDIQIAANSLRGLTKHAAETRRFRTEQAEAAHDRRCNS